MLGGAALLVCVTLGFIWLGPERGGALRVFTARTILTLDASAPRATAVAVAAGRIVSVGSLASVERELAEREFVLDERFASKVLVPGFIDPHVHPALAATILPLEIVSAVEWDTPQGRTRSVRGHEAFVARLRELDGERSGDDWLMVWGYHRPYHGELSRALLDGISTRRPIFVWQRSVHEGFFNSRALEVLELSQGDFDAHPQADWVEGHIWEAGMLDLGQPILRQLAAPRSYWRGLGMMGEVYHRGGLTTVGEQGFPQISAWGELVMLNASMWWRDVPFRFVLVPNAMYLMREHSSAAKAERAASRMLARSTERVRFVKHVKYYADGAIFSQLMRMAEPYLDGHHGEWMMSPDAQAEVLDTFWRAGWGVHVHVNGDAGGLAPAQDRR